MKKAIPILGVLAACFAAALLALRVDRLLTRTDAPAGPATMSVPIRSATFGAPGQPIDFRDAVKRLAPSVVSVDKLEQVSRGFFSDSYEIAQTSTGSGVIVSAAGHIVTNHHVVENAYSVQVRLADGRTFDAKVVGSDSISDLAVLKIDAPGLVPAELGDNSKLEPGEWVLAMGNPLGFSNTVSVGVVSSVNRTLPTENGSVLVDSIQTDAAINQGNSGGALANVAGQVVGINSIIATTTGGNMGLGFAIPINRVRRIVDDILKYGRARYGTLGLRIFSRSGMLARASVRDSIRQTIGATPPDEGLIVRTVMPNGPAAGAGIGELDVLLELDGVKLLEPFDYIKAVVDKQPGDRVKVKFWSKGKERTVQVTLTDS
ncbi:MAG: trypsin-like peptidase domain-containing protein [Fimbriimonadaceae bacterium]|nr:trypsin-like peptidase domain-containing protein [Chthonomonadaceae bacterium]MCO5295828.1 trypsin-like peptidase domain-containing protein [Fimbriimonadaceae bacterium]